MSIHALDAIKKCLSLIEMLYKCVSLVKTEISELENSIRRELTMIEQQSKAKVKMGGGGHVDNSAGRRKRNRNKQRDSYIYNQIVAGTTLTEIKQFVRSHESWEPIDTDQGISQAAGRFAKRYKKKWPLKQNH